MAGNKFLLKMGHVIFFYLNLKFMGCFADILMTFCHVDVVYIVVLSP